MQDITKELNTAGLPDSTSLNLGIDPSTITTIVTLTTIGSILLTILFVIHFIRSALHRKKSERTIIEMAQNIRDIKALLERQDEETPPATPSS